MASIGILLSVQVLVSAFFFLYLRNRLRKALDLDDIVGRVRSEVSSLVVELNGTADRNVSLVEDRLSALRSLLSEADQRIAMLGNARKDREAERQLYDRSGRGIPPNQGTDPRQAPPPRERAPDVATRPGRDGSEGEQAARLPFITFSKDPIRIEPSFRDRVLEMYRRGFSSDIIAARLSTTISEVDLVVSLEEGRAPPEAT